MELVILWLVLSVVAGVIASNKGRSGFGFFLLAVLFSPIVGILGALIARPAEQIEKDLARHGGSDEFKKCPYCAEVIRKEAIKCRFCGTELAEADTNAVPAHSDSSVIVPTAVWLGKMAGKAKARYMPPAPQKEKTLEEILADEANESTRTR